jgi:hypothetical protein
MGKPTAGNTAVSCGESIAAGSEPGEVKHLSTRRKRKQTVIPLVVASESGSSPNRFDASRAGVAGRNGDDPREKFR